MSKTIQFSDRLNKLFPDKNPVPIHINGPHVKDITFCVCEDCNMRCTYCYEHIKRPNHMTFEVGKKFIDMLLAADERSNKYITSTESKGCALSFIGGEPLLQIDLIDQLTDYFIEQAMLLQHPWATRYRLSICTNGLLYFDEKVQNYIKKNAENLSLSISIDGNKELHDACRIDTFGNGTYDRAIAAVEHYRTVYGGMVGSKMTIAPGNVEHLFSAAKSMIEFGYDDIHMNCVYEEGWTNKHAKIMYEQLKILADYMNENNLTDKVYISMVDKQYLGRPIPPEDNKNYCGGTGLMIAVDWKGDIYPCLRYMDNAICGKQEPYIIGNVDTGIMATPEQCARVDCMACVTRRSQSTDECFNCPIAMGCGTCSAYNYEVFGTPNHRATFICCMHKARVLGASYLWNNWFRKNGKSERFKLNIPEEWAVEIIGKDEWNYLNELAKEG